MTPSSFEPHWLARYSSPDPGGAADPGIPGETEDAACAFCAIAAGGLEAHIIAESADTLCFLDHLPATFGHALVVPKQHYRDLFDIPETSLHGVVDMAKQVAEALRTSCSAAGVNLVHASGLAAHQTVFHFHLHVVPRYDGDSIVVFPRLADPAHALAMAQRLRSALSEHSPRTRTGSRERVAP